MTEFFGFPRDGHTYSADEVGRAFAGFFERESNGTPRVGMLSLIPSVTAVNGAWKIQVGIFTYIHQVLGSVQMSGLSASEQHDIVPAAGNIPVGQARIDLVGWNPTTAEIVVVTGEPSASPTAPADASLAPIATVRINSGDGAVIPGQITILAQTTDLVGMSGKDGAFATGNGWSVQAGVESSLESIGRVAYLNTALVIAAAGSFTSILTVGQGFRPAKDTYVGYSQVSGGAGRAHGDLLLRPTGVLQMVNYQGTTNAGNVLPVSAHWRLPKE